MRQQEIQIFDGNSVLQANFTVDTTNNTIICNSHGLKSGDIIRFTTTGTLPAGLSTNTDYYVIEPTTDTFKVSTILDGIAAVDITNNGTGIHTLKLYGKPIFVDDYQHMMLSMSFTDTAVMTVKVQGSQQNEHYNGMVNFRDAQSKDNRWDYIEIIDNEDGSAIDGDVGITTSANDNRLFVANIEHLRWVTIDVTSFTTGRLSAYIKLSDNS